MRKISVDVRSAGLVEVCLKVVEEDGLLYGDDREVCLDLSGFLLDGCCTMGCVLLLIELNDGSFNL